MVKIPENPNAWNESIIREILEAGFEESEVLEFKFEIPRDNKLGKVVCAFANSKKGGTIVFWNKYRQIKPRRKK